MKINWRNAERSSTMPAANFVRWKKSLAKKVREYKDEPA